MIDKPLTISSLIVVLASLVVLSTLTGHYLPPTGILTSPFITSIITGLVMLTDSKLKLYFKTVIVCIFISINDIGIRLFAGGVHDIQGNGWISVMLLVGLIPSFLLLFLGVYNEKDTSVFGKLSCLGIFIVWMFIYIKQFGSFGIEET